MMALAESSATWICVSHFIATHEIVIQSGPNWWTHQQTDIAIPGAMPLGC